MLGLAGSISPFGRVPSLTHVVEMECLGASSALQCGRGDRAPPRKPTSMLSPGFPRKVSQPRLPPRRGGLRTPAKEGIAASTTLPLLGHRLLRLPPMIMLCLGSLPARISGRGDRAPPRKSPFALSPGLPPQGPLSLDSPPRGGAGSARPQGRHRLDRGMSPLGHGHPATHLG